MHATDDVKEAKLYKFLCDLGRLTLAPTPTLTPSPTLTPTPTLTSTLTLTLTLTL